MQNDQGAGGPKSTSAVELDVSPPEELRGGSNFSLIDADGEILASPSREDMRSRLEQHTFFWLDVHAPSSEDIDELGELFGFHPLALDDAKAFNQRPKIEAYEGYTFLVVYGAVHDADGLVEVHCFSAEHYLVSVRHDDCPTFASLQRRYMKKASSIAEEPMLLYQLVDGLTDSFFPALGEMDDRIDTLETEIFDSPKEEQLREVFAMKHRLIDLRRVIAPQRDMFAQVAASDIELPGRTDDTAHYFRDVYDHLIRLSDMIDNYRDLLTGVIDVYLSSVANRRDQVVKNLTVLATIFLPITFITGFFGQNFGSMVRTINTPTAFVLGVSLQVLTVAGILLFFRRRGWI
jgi:magnesium transporter